jgi:hypothetical protein
VQLAWAPVATAATYNVTRGALLVGTIANTTFTDDLLWPQTTYTYSVSALSSSGATISTQTVSATTPAIGPGGFPRFFPATSIWNAPVGPAALASNSSGMISYFAANAKNPNMTLHAWGVAVAEAQPGDSIFNVPCTVYTCTLGAFGPFAIPTTAAPDPQGDGHLAVYDPSSQREWDFWQAKHSGNSWSASAGSAVSLAGNGMTAAGTASANAANMPLLGGLIRPEELLQGHIDHALVFGMPNVNSTKFVCPATHHDGSSTDPSSLPEGTRSVARRDVARSPGVGGTDRAGPPGLRNVPSRHRWFARHLRRGSDRARLRCVGEGRIAGDRRDRAHGNPVGKVPRDRSLLAPD